MNKSFVLLFLLAFTLGIAQPSDKQRQLEEQKQQIQKEIATFKKLLQNETKKEKSVLTEIANQKAHWKATLHEAQNFSPWNRPPKNPQ